MASTTWSVPLADVAVDEEILAAAHGAISSGWWSMGPRVEEFESAFAGFCRVRHALAVSSGTAALHLALLAVGCGPGDEVVLPSLGFVAAANVTVHTGATPVFSDVKGPDDLNLDPASLAAAVGPRTKALLVLHYGGFACDMGDVLEIARSRGIAVIEDAAHAPGATWEGRPCGSIGDVGCFSFFSNKNLPLGEGGMVVAGDDEIAARLRLLRSHGMTTLTWDRHRGHAGSYDVVAQGLNYRLDEIRAAIGLAQLGRLAAWNDRRRAVAARYAKALDGVEGISVPFRAHDQASSAHHIAVVLLPGGARRDAVRARLAERGIQTSVHYPPIHRFTAYAASAASLPRTEAVAERLLTIPLFPHLEDSQVDAVIDALVSAVRSA